MTDAWSAFAARMNEQSDLGGIMGLHGWDEQTGEPGDIPEVLQEIWEVILKLDEDGKGELKERARADKKTGGRKEKKAEKKAKKGKGGKKKKKKD